MRISGPYDAESLKGKINASEKAQLLEGVQESGAESDAGAVARIRKVEKGDGTAGAVVLAENTSSATAIVSGTEEKRKSSVGAIKAQVDAGTYQVDTDKLAEKLVDDELVRQGRA